MVGEGGWWGDLGLPDGCIALWPSGPNHPPYHQVRGWWVAGCVECCAGVYICAMYCVLGVALCPLCSVGRCWLCIDWGDVVFWVTSLATPQLAAAVALEGGHTGYVGLASEGGGGSIEPPKSGGGVGKRAQLTGTINQSL